MKLLKFASFLFLILAISSCNGFESLEVKDIEQFKFTGFENNVINVDIAVPINNPNAMSIKLKGMDMKAYYKGRPLGYVTSNEKITIKGKTKEVYHIPVSIRITNFLQGLSLMANTSNIKTNDFSFKGSIDVKYFLMTHKYDIDEDMMKQYLH